MVKCRAALAMGAIACLALALCQADITPVEDAAQFEQGSGVTMLDNESIRIPDVAGQVRLHNGAGEFEIVPGSSKGRVTLIEGTQHTWQTSDRTDLITAMTVGNGGSGTFSYIAIYSKKDGAVALADSAFLGDRIKITNVGIGELAHDRRADYRITIQMLQRADDGPMTSQPSVPSTRVFYVTNGKLEAVSPVKNDT